MLCVNKEAYYELLASKFVTYKDLLNTQVKDNNDPLIAIGQEFEGKVYVQENYKPYTGNKTYVRSQIIPLLVKAQKELKIINPDYSLEVYCGYRPLEIQEEGFNKHSKVVLAEKPNLKGEELKEEVHRYAAVPEVAGHPTGGAVDVRIITSSGILNMGTSISDPNKDTYVFSPFIEKDEWHNRQILRACMVKAGFAPFDGEWWHFSYGDREWASYYNQPYAFYSQLRLKI